jgi:hypothetical protein
VEGTELRLEQFGNPLVGVNCADDLDEFFGRIAYICVQRKDTTLFAAERCSRSLYLYRVVNPDGAVAVDELLYGGNKRR